MDLHQALHGRRTVHSYEPRPIPEEAVQRALEAAVMAPNHRLTFPWRFTRPGPRARADLADLAVRVKTKSGSAATPEREQKIRGKVLDPAALIVVSLVKNTDPAIAREDYASAACAIQNMFLSLHADGIASKWSTGKLTQHAETYERLSIDPEQEEIVGFIWAGIAAQVPPAPERPDLGELVRVLP